MKIKALYRSYFFAVLLLLIFLQLGCERLETVTIDGFDCRTCYQNRPDWVQLNVVTTINEENPFVPITIYIGNVEDGNIDWVDTSYSESYWVDVKPDRYYSVKAEYKDGSSTVYAIDGDKIKQKQNTTDCDVPCYYQAGGYIDVRLLH